MHSAPTVSIIIPTLNEADSLTATLERIIELQPAPAETLVVDGASEDETLKVARRLATRVFESSVRRRSYQLDLGARQARGDILAFVHADTLLPVDAIDHMRQTLATPEVTLGGFTSIMRGTRVQRVTTAHNWIKTYYAPLLYRPFAVIFRGLRLLFGDQVMFCRRSDYLAVGGFDPAMEVMEEADLCLKMNTRGRIRQIRPRVYTSDRRVARYGVVRSNLLFIAIALGWGYGASRDRLRRWFDGM